MWNARIYSDIISASRYLGMRLCIYGSTKQTKNLLIAVSYNVTNGCNYVTEVSCGGVFLKYDAAARSLPQTQNHNASFLRLYHLVCKRTIGRLSNQYKPFRQPSFFQNDPHLLKNFLTFVSRQISLPTRLVSNLTSHGIHSCSGFHHPT